MHAGRMPALPGLTDSALRGNVRCAKANGLIVDVGSALGVQRRPARRILEQPDCSDFAVLAQIEPVQSAPRNADQIAGFDLYCNDGRFARMNVKQATAMNNEANFVLVVPVLAVEPGKHSFEAWRARVHVNHVRSNVAAYDLEPLDFV